MPTNHKAVKRVPRRRPRPRFQMTNEQYLASKGILCPFCREPTIEGNSIEIDGGTATQEVGCNNCDKVWTDVYVLSHYTVAN